MSERAENRPDQRLRYYPLDVFRVKSGVTCFVRTLSPDYGGLYTHYERGRSHYCPGDRCGCVRVRLPRIWKGYASVEVYDGRAKLWAPAVLEITEGLELDLRGQYARGQVWELTRDEQTDKKATPVRGRLLEVLKAEQVPAAFPFKPVLIRVYHAPEGLETCHANPMPPRVMVSHSEGPPPKVPPAPDGQERPADALPLRELVARLRDRGALGDTAAKNNGQHTTT